MRRGRRPLVPAHVHAPSQRVHDLRLNWSLLALDKGSHPSAFAFTHRVSVPNQRQPAPVLGFFRFGEGELPDLG